MAFADPDELNALLGFTVDLERAVLFLDLASDAVIAAADVPIIEVLGDVETLDGSGAATLLLSSYPVTAVSQVAIDGDVIASDDYSWSRTGILERSSGVWPVGRRNIAVTYTHGYAADLPADIKRITLKVAARGLANPTSAARESTGGWSGQYDGGLDLTDDEVAGIHRALK